MVWYGMVWYGMEWNGTVSVLEMAAMGRGGGDGGVGGGRKAMALEVAAIEREVEVVRMEATAMPPRRRW